MRLADPSHIANMLADVDRKGMNFRQGPYRGTAQQKYRSMANVLVKAISPIVTTAYDNWYAQRSKATDVTDPR